MNNSRKLTTIAISFENYNALKELGKTGQSFNDVLNKLLGEKTAIQSNYQRR
jgi:predicted CopG family antitoxin